jgi:transposase
MGRGTWSWIVPDGLWEIAKPLIPPSKVRPQGGGTQDMPDETLFAAIIYVLVSGCAWRALPPCFGISKSTAHRRFLIWSRAGVWGRLHEAVLHRLDDAGLIDVTRVVLDTAHVRAKKGAHTQV